MKRWLPLLVMVLAVVAAVGIGARGDGSPQTPRERTIEIASRVKCPTCQGLSVAQSKTPVSVGIFDEIERQVSEGRSDAEVMSYLSSRYGDGLLINPPASGAGSVVWIAPIVVLIGGFVVLGFALRRWRTRVGRDLTDDDKAAISRAKAGAAS